MLIVIMDTIFRAWTLDHFLYYIAILDINIWEFPKIGVGPQNGWFFSWKPLFFDGWFGRKKPHHFRLNTHIKLTSYGHGAPRCQAAYSKRLFADNLDRPWAEKRHLKVETTQEPGFWMILVGVHLFGEFKSIRTKQRKQHELLSHVFFSF